jgi:ribonuclease HII
MMICGVDEAGRGPLAGPVHAAAVILDPARRVNGLADSKVLTPEKRQILAERIKARAIAWSVASASVEEIDRLNIFHASMLAMRRAIDGLSHRPEEVLVDGNALPPGLDCAARAVVDGDAKHKPISAASILAKTARDAEMTALHQKYPQYGFDRHKGYGTSEHIEALGRLGPCEIHRRSFYAVGVFFQQDLFSGPWSAMAEPLRVRSFRMYCDAHRLTAEKSKKAFDAERRRLRREYSDVLAEPQATPHADLVEQMLSKARRALR